MTVIGSSCQSFKLCHFKAVSLAYALFIYRREGLDTCWEQRTAQLQNAFDSLLVGSSKSNGFVQQKLLETLRRSGTS